MISATLNFYNYSHISPEVEIKFAGHPECSETLNNLFNFVKSYQIKIKEEEYSVLEKVQQNYEKTINNLQKNILLIKYNNKQLFLTAENSEKIKHLKNEIKKFDLKIKNLEEEKENLFSSTYHNWASIIAKFESLLKTFEFTELNKSKLKEKESTIYVCNKKNMKDLNLQAKLMLSYLQKQQQNQIKNINQQYGIEQEQSM